VQQPDEPRRLIVSIHDVSPASFDECRRAAAALRERGVARFALFVVPDFHGRHPLHDATDLVSWLQGEQSLGAEIVLHGLRHRVETPAARSAGSWFLRNLYTARECEFEGLDRAAFAEKIEAGLHALRQAGFHPKGFVAPAWIMPRSAPDWLGNAGFAYTETLTEIELISPRRTIRSPCLVYSSRSALRLATSHLWNNLLHAASTRAPVLRLALHPADLRSGSARAALLRHLERALEDRAPITYSDLL